MVDESCVSLREEPANLGPLMVFHRPTGLFADPVESAEALHIQLEQQVSGPVIYVAASYAAFTALHLADRYRSSVAGIVLVDGSHPRQSAAALAELPDDLSETQEISSFRSYLQGFGPRWEQSCAAVASIGSLGNLPLIALAAGDLEMPTTLPADIRRRLLLVWHSLQRDHAWRSSRGELRIVANSGHNIAQDDPAAVIQAIKDIAAVAARDIAVPNGQRRLL